MMIFYYSNFFYIYSLEIFYKKDLCLLSYLFILSFTYINMDSSKFISLFQL